MGSEKFGINMSKRCECRYYMLEISFHVRSPIIMNNLRHEFYAEDRETKEKEKERER